MYFAWDEFHEIILVAGHSGFVHSHFLAWRGDNLEEFIG